MCIESGIESISCGFNLVAGKEKEIIIRSTSEKTFITPFYTTSHRPIRRARTGQLTVQAIGGFINPCPSVISTSTPSNQSAIQWSTSCRVPNSLRNHTKSASRITNRERDERRKGKKNQKKNQSGLTHAECGHRHVLYGRGKY